MERKRGEMVGSNEARRQGMKEGDKTGGGGGVSGGGERRAAKES